VEQGRAAPRALGIGSLVRPEDIYLRPEVLQASLDAHMGLDLDQLGAVDVLERTRRWARSNCRRAPRCAFTARFPR
jgi:transcription-repair coupling factor (superfamily II helicase)